MNPEQQNTLAENPQLPRQQDAAQPEACAPVNFNYSSERAKKARLAEKLGSKGASAVGWGLSLAGFLLLIYLGPISGKTFLATIGLLPWSIWWPLHLYHQFYLSDIPLNLNSGQPQISLDDILEQSVLAKLGQNPSPQQIGFAVKGSQASNYFAWRFGLSNDFYTNLSSDHPEDDCKTWLDALSLMQNQGERELRAEHLIAALVLNIEEIDKYLAQLQLQKDDVLAGLSLFKHRRLVLSSLKQKKNVGGIGRDLAFGYTPTLENFSHNITNDVVRGAYVHRRLESHQDILAQLSHVLTTSPTRAAALVGKAGVGRSTLVWALADLLISDQSPKELKFNQVFSIDTATLISKIKSSGGQAEGILTALFVEASHAKNIVLAIENAEKLFEDEGAGTYNLINILVDLINKGAAPVVLSVSENAWMRASQIMPSLSQAVQYVPVKPQTQQEAMLTLEDQTLILENRYKVVYMYQALKKAVEIGERFVREKALPGSALSILESASGKPEEGLITKGSIEKTAEEIFGVKVQTANSADERQTLLNLEDLIHQGMINQTHAVKAVSDSLRQARAGVKAKTRAMGAFLFLGPTGVGKTELAKQLAKVYFGGEQNIIRINLNEYTQSTDVTRLLQAPSENPLSLTAQIFKKPFSVVLFDEIEKAHPQVLDLFLQLLDEGILTDTEGKTVSFNDAIIITTSNAGSDLIFKLLSEGTKPEDLPTYEKQIIDTIINQGLFRPEFINRFDEAIVFRPLNKDELGQVANLIIGDIAANLQTNQKLSLNVGADVISLLVEKGYDPTMGARPMRRIISKTIENIVANKILAGGAEAGATINVSLDDVQKVLEPA
jgi:ATP-dependent Clp protease ATP-binding subunit ClpC